MASRDELYTALRNADAAGDNEGAQKLAAYIQGLPPEDAPAEEPQGKSDAHSKPDVSTLDRANALAAGVNSGVAGIVGLPVDTMANIIDLGKAAVGTAYHAATGNNIPKGLEVSDDRSDVVGSGDWFRAQLNKIGRAAENPHPEDRASRMLYAAGGGVSSVLLPGGAGVPKAVSGVTGALASQTAAELGASREVQAAAGFLGAVVPSVARIAPQSALRIAARGGASAQNVADNIAAFDRAGTTPSMGQATQSRTMQATESLLSRTPGAAGRMTATAERQQAALGANLERQASSLAPSASGEQAGRAITRGISDRGGFLDRFKTRADQLYSELDNYVKPDQPVQVSNTQTALKDLSTPIKGAENTSRNLMTPQISQIADAFAKDATNGVMPYEAVKQLRTLVGQKLADAPLQSDVPIAQWRRLYASLSADMQGAAQTAGPDAQRAFSRANAYYAAGSKRLDLLQSVIDKNGGPEAVFKAATSGTREGASTLRAVMQSLPSQEQKTVTATVLRRLGRAKAGVQDDTGDVFSTETFLTNWNTMSPQAKNVLFDRYGPDFRQNMDSIATVASNLRTGSKVFRNPSGTGQAVSQTAAATAFLGALFTGHVAGAVTVAGGVGSANLAARFMTNPNAVRWLAKTTRASQSALPALINQAQQSPDPDIQELGELMQQ